MDDKKNPIPPSVEHLRRLIAFLRETPQALTGEHLNDEKLVAYVEGSLLPEDALRIDLHLASCEECTLEAERLLTISEGVLELANRRYQSDLPDLLLVINEAFQASSLDDSWLNLSTHLWPKNAAAHYTPQELRHSTLGSHPMVSPDEQSSGNQGRCLFQNTCGVPQIEAPMVFLSYSRKDSRWASQLRSHLEPLEHLGFCRIASDFHAAWNGRWSEQAVSGAIVAVLLISDNYLSSDSVTRDQWSAFLEGQKAGKLKIFPVLLKDCRWDIIPGLSSVWTPRDTRPVVYGRESKERLATLSVEIASLVVKSQCGAGHDQEELWRHSLPFLNRSLLPDRYS